MSMSEAKDHHFGNIDQTLFIRRRCISQPLELGHRLEITLVLGIAPFACYTQQ